MSPKSFIVPLIAGAILAGCTAPPANHDDDDGDDTIVPPDAGRLDDGAIVTDPDGTPPDEPDAMPTPPDAVPLPQTFQVCPSGGDFTTVGAALAAASAGDTIEICPGTYHERIVVEAAVTITGTGGPGATILDGDHAGTVMTVRNTAGAGVVVSGLSFVNGDTTAQGGGVWCESSVLAMSNSRIATSEASNGGGGLGALSCTLDIGTTRIEQNEGGPRGGGVLVMMSTGSIHHGWIDDNTADEGAGVNTIEGAVGLAFDEIKGNAARVRGGGVYHASDATIESCTISGNSGGWTGGGVFVMTHAPLLLTNQVLGNTAINDGGGIYLHMSGTTVRGCTVRDNSSGDDGGGIRAFESSCTLDANLVEHNQTADGGGGIRVSHVPCLLTDNLVRNNTAGGTGGGMDLDNDASTVRGGEITGNHAGGSGGGIFTWLAPWSGTTIEGVLIEGNTAWKGGGIFAVDNYKPLKLKSLRLIGNHAGRGGALMIGTTAYTLTDSLIADNNADIGAGVYHAAPKPPEDPCGAPDQLPCPPLHASGVISQSVFYANVGGGAQLTVADEGLTVSSVIIAGHTGTAAEVIQPEDPLLPAVPAPAWRYTDTLPATFLGMAAPTGSDGNLETNPAFLGADAGDFHLDGDSACIGAGDPQFSITGVAPDMGMVGGAP